MTNLIATILVTVLTTTNDVPRWRPQTCQDGPNTWLMYVDEASLGFPLVNSQTGKTNEFIRFPTTISGSIDERVRIVQTKRMTRLTFDWNGKPREIVDEDVLEEARTLLIRHETWSPKEDQK